LSVVPTQKVDLRPYTTLRAGGPADFFLRSDDVDTLAEGAQWAWKRGLKVTPLGWGSNVLPADAGVSGLVVLNRTASLSASPDGNVLADSGVGFGDLFVKTAQAELGGLEFAVGIPGSVGGALVSNAGAYRSCVSEFLLELEVVTPAGRAWVGPEWMGFAYRDSVLRRPGAPAAIVLRVRMQLPHREPKAIYDEAREYQRQRISKQPPSPSAGSFFKNVVDADLAQRIPGLTDGMRAAGVVPAGFLMQECGLKGHRIGGAMLGVKHANFLLNVGGAKASDLRALAAFAREEVLEKFGVTLEEEVLYIGRW
jgi:UDP-N-acetylmuramate dehydrogenase